MDTDSRPEMGDPGRLSLPVNPHHPVTKWQEAKGSYNKTVLRYCDQYLDHNILMATMLDGAAVMDVALLLIAGTYFKTILY